MRSFSLLDALLIAGGVLALGIALWQIVAGPRLVSSLIIKYLIKRKIAWVSLVAVMLCTTMVLVVISVMGGWLRMFRQTTHNNTGDLVIYRMSLSGFPYYQEMLDRIDKLPEVKGAVPMLHTYGLINISNDIRDGVEVVGMDLGKMGLVDKFPESLYLKPKQLEEMAKTVAQTPAEKEALLAKAKTWPSFDKPLPAEEYRSLAGKAKGTDPADWPGMIVGDGVIGIKKGENGKIDRYPYPIIYSHWARLTVMGVSDNDVEAFNPQNRSVNQYWLVDDSRTDVYMVDAKTVYVPFDVLQRDLHMDAQTYTSAKTGMEVTEPARTNEIHIGLKDAYQDDASLRVMKDKVSSIVAQVVAEHHLWESRDPITTETWMERNAEFLGAVEKEKVLLTFLFGLISIVAIFLIFCIFFMIVVEKTRDIGIIKSVGATSLSVAGLFLGYGLALGIVGGGFGFGLGWLIVHYINQLHAWMGRVMHVQIWDPKTYAFDTIPNTINPREAAIIVGIAILSSLLGAIIPAVRAARMNPVDALRWE